MDKTSATMQFNDLIIGWIPLLISILCLGVGFAIVYVFILNKKWSSLKDGFPVCLALIFFILIGACGLVEAKLSLKGWATALGAAALLAIIIILYNPFNISDDARSVEEDLQPREFDALQELEFERRIMDRIQQRITGFTTMLALFGVFIGLFGYISLLNIDDTKNTVDQLGIKAERALSSLHENIETSTKEKLEAFSRKLDDILEEKIKEQEEKIAETVTEKIALKFGADFKIAGKDIKENRQDIEDLNNKLGDYAMKTELKDKVTTNALDKRLNGYATKTELEDKVTTNALDKRLNGYATKTELEDKVTTNALDKRLNGYATKTELEDKVTTNALKEILNNYEKKPINEPQRQEIDLRNLFR